MPARNDAPVPNPGNARWCDLHGRLECVKNRSKDRGPCHQAAVKGTDACRNHAGRATALQIEMGQAAITAFAATGEPTINPARTVLQVLQMSYLRMNAYGKLLAQQVAKEGMVPEEDLTRMTAMDQIEPGGLIGFRYGAAGKEGTIYIVAEEVRSLVALEAAERDKVIRYAKTAHDMGISAQLLDLAKRWTDIAAGRVVALLAALDLTPEQMERVPALVDRFIGSIDMETPMAALELVQGEVIDS